MQDVRQDLPQQLHSEGAQENTRRQGVFRVWPLSIVLHLPAPPHIAHVDTPGQEASPVLFSAPEPEPQPCLRDADS